MNPDTLHRIVERYEAFDTFTPVTDEIVRQERGRACCPVNMKSRELQRFKNPVQSHARQAYIEKLLATKERLRKKLAEKISP